MTVTQSLSTSLHHLNRSLLVADLADLSDADLVGRFAERRDEAAFAALVRRHGALVLGVCRRVLRHEQDAEDAFQATFLVFARDAAAVRRASAVGNWLYGVAYNVARRARAARNRRTVKEQEAATRQPASARETAPDDLRDVLDQELNALPDKYRAAVVLCDLTGLTAQRAAVEVGCPPKTLGTRLARGRALLARRLARRGVGLSACMTAAALTPVATAVPPKLIESTVQLAANPAVVAAPAITALTAGGANVMLLKTLKIGSVLACGVLFAGGVALHGGFAAHGTPASARAGTAAPTGPKPARAEPPDPLAHLHQFFRQVHELLGIEPARARAATPDDKKDDKPALSGVWVKKKGELKIAFDDKNVMTVTPHGDDKVLVIVCECTPGKDGRVKAKVTGIEGEAKQVVAEKLPIGTEFSFTWKANANAATLGDVKGDKDKADLLKSHLEAEYAKK